jgi:hypothetical protein
MARAVFLALSFVAATAQDYPPAQYHTVDQDHFDGSNSNTWRQAYFVNDAFWKA